MACHSKLAAAYTRRILTLQMVLRDVLIVAAVFALCVLFIWLWPPGRKILIQPPSLDSKRKLTWLAVVGCVLTLIYFLITDYRLTHLK
nr:hypothetical protein [Candidatus Acidoferrales bacterium]